MKRAITIISILFLLIPQIYSQPKFVEMSVKPGAFSRMGFGARGIAMGNSISAVTQGNLVSYYNPAASPFQEGNLVQSGYTFLSLDRSLNYLSFTRKFDFYSSTDTAINRQPRGTAGISAGIINSGVGNIDGRDNNGIKTEELSTSENQFFLSVSNRFSRKLSIGVAIKFYYYKLYEDITSNGIGLDLGAIYKIDDNWNVSFVISDLNSSYKWDSSPIYEQDGLTTTDKFPILKKIGMSYFNPELKLLTALEFENSNAGTNIIRVGIEYNIYDGLFLRGGIDQFNISDVEAGAKPALGFAFQKHFGDLLLSVDYAFMIEQYSPSDRHVIGLNFNF